MRPGGFRMTNAADSSVVIYHMTTEAAYMLLIIFLVIPFCLHWIYGFICARRFDKSLGIALAIGFIISITLVAVSYFLILTLKVSPSILWLALCFIGVSELLAVLLLPAAKRTGPAKVGMVALLVGGSLAASVFFGLDLETISATIGNWTRSLTR